jgi:hypothetical protein
MAERGEDDRRRRDARVPMLGLITVANVLTVLGGVYYMGSWTSAVSSEQRHTTKHSTPCRPSSTRRARRCVTSAPSTCS